MSELTKTKEKVVNVGITEELKDFLDKWSERAMQETEDKEKEKKEYTKEIKTAIVEIAKRELEKVDKELKELNGDDEKWYRLVEKIDKISDLVRWY